MINQERIPNREKIVSSTNRVVKTGQQHAKGWNWITLLHHSKKPQNGLKTKCEAWKYKNPRGEHRDKPLWYHCSNCFLDILPRQGKQKQKETIGTSSK